MQRFHLLVGALFATAAAAQQSLVVPASSTNTDAPSVLKAAGLDWPMRQQVLIDAVHLDPVLRGHRINGLQLRRDAGPDDLQGGAAQLTVKLSTSPNSSTSASQVMAQNRGTDERTVYQGIVTIPLSPGINGPIVPWDASNTVTINFTSTFLYAGGNLCVEIEGSPLTGQSSPWWPVDAAFDATTGSSTSVGTGCGPWSAANPNGQWSWAVDGTLVPGGTAQFTANGTPGALAVAAFAPNVQPGTMNLEPLGSAPGCQAHIATLLAQKLTTFATNTDPATPVLGSPASAHLPIPNMPWVLGATFAVQWFEFSLPFTASNAVQWTIASGVPGMGMATVQQTLLPGGGAGTPRVTTKRAPVLRFLYP